MGHYLQLNASLVYSPNSDLSNPVLDLTTLDPMLLSGLTGIEHRRWSAPVAGTTLSFAHFSTIPLLAFWNRDTTNYITLTYSLATGSTAATAIIKPGGFTVVSGVKPATALSVTANTAACEFEIVVAGT